LPKLSHLEAASRDTIRLGVVLARSRQRRPKVFKEATGCESSCGTRNRADGAVRTPITDGGRRSAGNCLSSSMPNYLLNYWVRTRVWIGQAFLANTVHRPTLFRHYTPRRDLAHRRTRRPRIGRSEKRRRRSTGPLREQPRPQAGGRRRPNRATIAILVIDSADNDTHGLN